MSRRFALILLLLLSACATAPRPLPRADAPEPLDPSIKSLVQEQEEQAG